MVIAVYPVYLVFPVVALFIFILYRLMKSIRRSSYLNFLNVDRIELLKRSGDPRSQSEYLKSKFSEKDLLLKHKVFQYLRKAGYPGQELEHLYGTYIDARNAYLDINLPKLAVSISVASEINTLNEAVGCQRVDTVVLRGLPGDIFLEILSFCNARKFFSG